MEDYHTHLHRNRGNSPPHPTYHSPRLLSLTLLLAWHKVVLVRQLSGLCQEYIFVVWRWYCTYEEISGWQQLKGLLAQLGKHKRSFTMSWFVSSRKNKVSKFTAQDSYTPSRPQLPVEGPSRRLSWTPHPSQRVCMAQHGLFFFGTEDYRLFPDRSDFPIGNLFPHLDIDLHAITVHSTWEKSHTRTTWSLSREGTFTLVLWGTEVVSAPLMTAAAAPVLHHSQPLGSRKVKIQQMGRNQKSINVLGNQASLMTYGNSCH